MARSSCVMRFLKRAAFSSIFEKEGVIKLKPGIDKVTARISDIVENPKKLQFTPNVEASLLPQMYNNDEGDAVVINANYAIDAGLDPVHDPIAVESGENNPYANIITVHRGDEKKKRYRRAGERAALERDSGLDPHQVQRRGDSG